MPPKVINHYTYVEMYKKNPDSAHEYCGKAAINPSSSSQFNYRHLRDVIPKLVFRGRHQLHQVGWVVQRLKEVHQTSARSGGELKSLTIPLNNVDP